MQGDKSQQHSDPLKPPCTSILQSCCTPPLSVQRWIFMDNFPAKSVQGRCALSKLYWLTSPAITQKMFPAEMNLVSVQVRKAQTRVHTYVLHVWITSMKRCMCATPIHCICDIASLNLTTCAQILFVLTKKASMQRTKGQFVPLCRAVCTPLTQEAAVFWEGLVQCE